MIARILAALSAPAWLIWPLAAADGRSWVEHGAERWGRGA